MEQAKWDKLNVSVAQYTSSLPQITRVELNTLRFDGSAKNVTRRTKTFPIRLYDSEARVLQQRVLTGAEAERIAVGWRQLLLETSVCWHCSNFYLPKVGWYGFDAAAESGQALLKSLDSLLPYERSEPKTAAEQLPSVRP